MILWASTLWDNGDEYPNKCILHTQPSTPGQCIPHDTTGRYAQWVNLIFNFSLCMVKMKKEWQFISLNNASNACWSGFPGPSEKVNRERPSMSSFYWRTDLNDCTVPHNVNCEGAKQTPWWRLLCSVITTAPVLASKPKPSYAPAKHGHKLLNKDRRLNGGTKHRIDIH